MAQVRPLVLVIEDLHWADEGLLAFLEEMLDRTADVPLLVLCTARPELYDRHPSWGGGKRNSTTLALSPLSEEETARLVAATLDRAVLPAETQRVLLEQAGGNPLYAEEFTKMLVDRGILSRDGGAWAIREGATIPVPETVQAIIAARLDTLAPDRKALLLDAAVVGKVFWSGALAWMAGVDEALVREAMHELARKELVREARRSSVEGQAEYAFWHALVRDVAYGQIPRAARIEKHRAAAAWIERLAGERVADVAELLAHHLTSALVLAGDRVRNLDERRAAGYYRRALELIPEGHPEHPEVLLKWSEVASDVGLIGFDEARRGFEQAIEAFQACGDHRRAADAMARYAFPLWVRGEGARALDMARRAVELLEREGPSPDLAGAWASLAPRLLFGRETRASLEAADRALELARELDLPAVAARALQVRGMARCELNDLGGLDDLREALRAVRDLGLGANPTTTAHINLSWWVWLTEGPLPAIELHREAIAAWERRGLGRHVWVTGELCWLLFDAGRWDELLEAAAVLHEEERAGQAWQPGVMALAMRSFVEAHRGRAAQALARVPELAARAREVGDSQILIPPSPPAPWSSTGPAGGRWGRWRSSSSAGQAWSRRGAPTTSPTCPGSRWPRAARTSPPACARGWRSWPPGTGCRSSRPGPPSPRPGATSRRPRGCTARPPSAGVRTATSPRRGSRCWPGAGVSSSWAGMPRGGPRSTRPGPSSPGWGRSPP